MEERPNEKDTITILLVGDKDTGKSTLVKSFTGMKLSQEKQEAHDAKFLVRTEANVKRAESGESVLYKIDEKPYDPNPYLKGMRKNPTIYDAVIIVTDFNNPDSINNIRHWEPEVENLMQGQGRPLVYVVGNERDVMSTQKNENYQALGIDYVVNVKSGQDVSNLFEEITENIKAKKREIQEMTLERRYQQEDRREKSLTAHDLNPLKREEALEKIFDDKVNILIETMSFANQPWKRKSRTGLGPSLRKKPPDHIVELRNVFEGWSLTKMDFNFKNADMRKKINEAYEKCEIILSDAVASEKKSRDPKLKEEYNKHYLMFSNHTPSKKEVKIEKTDKKIEPTKLKK